MSTETLTLDLKNRRDEFSLVIDLSNYEQEGIVDINLNYTYIIAQSKELFKNSKYHEAKKLLESVAPYMNNRNDTEQYGDFIHLQNIYTPLCEALNGIEHGNLKGYVEVYESYEKLVSMVENKVVEEELQNSFINALTPIQMYINNFDFDKIVSEVQTAMESPDNLSYCIYVVELINRLFISEAYKNMLIERFKPVIDNVENMMGNALKRYNEGKGVQSSVKMLMPYEYGDLLNDKSLNTYIKALNKNYKCYDEMKKAMKNLHDIYEINKCKTYEAFSQKAGEIMDNNNISLGYFKSYYTEYIKHKLYDMDRKFFSMEDFIQAINNILSELSLYKADNVLYV